MNNNNNTGFYLIYVDESYDETHFAYTAMFVNAFQWNEYFKQVLDWRKDWFAQHGFRPDSELHATNFIGGRGGEDTNRNKEFRAELFYEAIGRVENMAGIQIINAITDKKK